MASCTLTQTAKNQLASLGVDAAQVQKKLDAITKLSNQEMGLLGSPLVRQLYADFSTAVSAILTGAVSEVTQQLISTITSTVNFTGGMLALITMLGSIETQVQLLLVSQLKRQLLVRIALYKLLIYHYQTLLRIFKLMQTPRAVPYTKLIAALPYVRKAEALFGQIFLAEQSNTSELPPRYSYSALKKAFGFIDTAVMILSSDGSIGGKKLGKALTTSAFSKRMAALPKKEWDIIGQRLAQELVLKSIAQSMSYLEHLSWNYIRIASLLPIPFEATDALYQPNNYTKQFIRKNGLTDTEVAHFDWTAADQAVDIVKRAVITQENKMLEGSTTALINAVDLLKGIIPTNILINSLIDGIIKYPTFNAELKSATSLLITALSPILQTVQNVREDMENAQGTPNNTLAIAMKEGVWLTQLNTVASLKNGLLPGMEGQAQLNLDADNLANLVAYLNEAQGSFAIAENIPKTVMQSLGIFRAPFSSRGLQECLVRTTAIIKQLQRGIQQDYACLNMTLRISEPFSQFKQVLDMAQQLPAPISYVATAITTGQLSQVLGLVSSLSLGTIDSTIALFSASCPDEKSGDDAELEYYDKLQDLTDKKLAGT